MRHGETDANLKGLITDDPGEHASLTEAGKKVTKDAAAALKQETDIDLIFSSPFSRTKSTAYEVAAHYGLKVSDVVEDDRLVEMKLGPKYDGKKWNDYHDAFPKTTSNFFLAPEGGESYADVRKRMLDFIFELEQKHQNKKILIVTHGGPSWLLTTGAQALSTEAALDAIKNVPDYHYFQNAEHRKIDFVPFPHNANFELDFHRPYIDAITLVDESGDEYQRIPEVIDCWFESGSMPFAQDHFPFDRPSWQKENFPAGFVAEYIAQTRTWFYYSLVISSILFDRAPFEHVVTTGTLQAEDGQKMSKSKGNFPDPWILFDKYGVDALRLYLMSSPLMKGEDANFSEKLVDDINKKLIGRFYNVLTFYELYRDTSLENDTVPASENVLDVWILSRLNQLAGEVTIGMENYDIVEATRPIDLFVDDLSTWYLRRSRDRIKEGNKDAKATLYFVIKTFIKLLAPFAPFTAEDIWQKLKGANDAESVHLSVWPEAMTVDEEMIDYMKQVRQIVSYGLEERQKHQIKVRQPLSKLLVRQYPFSTSAKAIDFMSIIMEELNVKEVTFSSSGNDEAPPVVTLITDITPELRAEGNARELMRALQDMRKAAGLTPSDVITLSVETNEDGKKLLEKFADDIKKTVLVSQINFTENDGQEIKIEENMYKVKIEK
jgi:isoleucyl-tRNA synthetase